MKTALKTILIIALSAAVLCACSNQDGKNSSLTADISQEAILTAQEMPPPFNDLPVESGGDERMPYYEPANFQLTAIPYELIKSVGVDAFEQWRLSMENSGSDRTDIENHVTLYSFCKHFNISNEQLTAYVEKQIKLEKDYDMLATWTEEDLAILLADDEAEIRRQFVSEYAILSNNKIYTPEWIYTHSLKDYEAEEIPFDLISSKVNLYKKIPFTSEALTALENKIHAYAKMQLTFEKTATEMPLVETAPSETIATEETAVASETAVTTSEPPATSAE